MSRSLARSSRAVKEEKAEKLIFVWKEGEFEGRGSFVEDMVSLARVLQDVRYLQEQV